MLLCCSRSRSPPALHPRSRFRAEDTPGPAALAAARSSRATRGRRTAAPATDDATRTGAPAAAPASTAPRAPKAGQTNAEAPTEQPLPARTRTDAGAQQRVASPHRSRPRRPSQTRQAPCPSPSGVAPGRRTTTREDGRAGRSGSPPWARTLTLEPIVRARGRRSERVPNVQPHLRVELLARARLRVRQEQRGLADSRLAAVELTDSDTHQHRAKSSSLLDTLAEYAHKIATSSTPSATFGADRRRGPRAADVQGEPGRHDDPRHTRARRRAATRPSACCTASTRCSRSLICTASPAPTRIAARVAVPVQPLGRRRAVVLVPRRREQRARRADAAPRRRAQVDQQLSFGAAISFFFARAPASAPRSTP